jgi:uncharacterized membrane protein YccC
VGVGSAAVAPLPGCADTGRVRRAAEMLRRFGRRLGAPYRERGRTAITWTLRLTIAAVASYVVARILFPESDALLAPLTALLVVQLTPVSLLHSGLDRVLSVVAGVGVAVAFSSLVSISWWSLGLVIALSLLIAVGLRLGNNALEVPISAMLVLGAGIGGAESAAWQRMAETLVGALVGIVSNLLVPPRVADKAAGAAIENLTLQLASVLEEAATDLDKALSDGEDAAERIAIWLGRIRALTHTLPDVGSALLQAEESRRLNVRALGTPDVGPVLRRAVEAIEHSAIAIRGMFRAMEDVGRARDRRPEDYRDDLDHLAIGLLLREIAAALRAFGRLVSAEAVPDAAPPPYDEVAEGIEALREARARLAILLTIDRRDDVRFAEITFSLMTTVERLARELDLEGRLNRLQQRAPPPPRRAALRSIREERGLTRDRVWPRRPTQPDPKDESDRDGTG